jgi:hypothetical protein
MLDNECTGSEENAGTDEALLRELTCKEALARQGLKVVLITELFIVFIAWANEWLDSLHSVVIPDGIITALHYLVLPFWFYAAVKILDLFTTWMTNAYYPKNLISWSVSAGAILLLLPFTTYYIASPVNAGGSTANCMEQQRNLIYALHSLDNFDPDISPHWTEAADITAKWLVCPATEGRFHTPGGYGLNALLVHTHLGTLPNQQTTVMTADSIEPGMLLSSDKDIDRTRHLYRGKRGYVCSFLDGHIEFRPAGMPVFGF